jgi:hypothetical protein
VTHNTDCRNAKAISCIPFLMMQQNRQTAQLGLYVLTRLGTTLRDATAEHAAQAEQPTRMQCVLAEIAKLGAREPDSPNPEPYRDGKEGPHR